MYAPKFRSWMTSWDRFDEALSYKLNTMAEEAHKEIREMATKAMEEIAPHPLEPVRHDPTLEMAAAHWGLLGPYFNTEYINQQQQLLAQCAYSQQQMHGPQYQGYPTLFGMPLQDPIFGRLY